MKSKRKQRIEAAKARPAEVTASLRQEERQPIIRNVKLNGNLRRMIGNKLLDD